MKTSFRWRLGFFGLAIGLMIGVMAWAVYTPWSLARRRTDRLGVVDLESFRLADQFQQKVLQRNDTLVRFSPLGDEVLWKDFEPASSELDRWWTEQIPRLRSQKELGFQEQVDRAYDLYLAAARGLGENRRKGDKWERSGEDMARFELEARRLLGLVFELAAAHRESLGESNRSLRILRNLLLAMLLALVGTGSGLGILFYRVTGHFKRDHLGSKWSLFKIPRPSHGG